ncbi:MAG TPA: hypothetical protein PLZ57_00270 [Pseudobdellovibrionaceae bacterium]|nr:hypothetical protein [Pseudobdellovibrionaceae bacterium]
MSSMSASSFNEFQVLSLRDLDEVYAWAKARAAELHPDDAFIEWTAAWRRESLEHYLATGWSMASRDPQSGQLRGFALAQPILFFRQQTQTVWLEYLAAQDETKAAELFQVMIGIARDKHMQRLQFVSSTLELPQIRAIAEQRRVRPVADLVMELPTTKE